MREVKINEYISLKLESKKDTEKKDIVIYVKEKAFIHCKCLLINPVSLSRKDLVPVVNSIDVISENMPYQERHSYWISEETEFWAYRSNLEAWCENNYSTELLHREIAFPLLKKLSDVGDPIALKVFREEIIKRLESGSENVIEYLINQKYLDYLDEVQLEVLFASSHYIERTSGLFKWTWSCGFPLLKKYADKNIKAALDLLKFKILKRLRNYDFLSFFIEEDYLEYLTEEEYRSIGITEELKEELKIVKDFHIQYKDKDSFLQESRETYSSSFRGNGYTVENGHVIGLDLHNHDSIYKKYRSSMSKSNPMGTFPMVILKLPHLEFLNLSGNHLESIPEEISQLKNLKIILLESNELKFIPESMGNLEHLEELDLRHNKLSKLPESIGNLKNLKILDLSGNYLIQIPQSIGKLQSLKILKINSFIRKNCLKEIPESLFKLVNLEILRLGENLLTTLSHEVGNLRNLRELDLSKNMISSIPNTIGNLQLLVKLNISDNKITELPDSISNLKSLTEFKANNNPIERIPESIINMNSVAVGPFLNWLAEKSSKQAQQILKEISLPLTDLEAISRFLSDLSKKTKDLDLNWKVKFNEIEHSLIINDQFIEKIRKLKDHKSQSKIGSIFRTLIELGSDRAKNILKNKLIEIVKSEETPSILYLVPYFRILDELDLKDVYKNINELHLVQLTEMLLEESKRDNYIEEERLEGTFFIQNLRSAGFDFILNLIRGLDGNAQRRFILFLFRYNNEDCYFYFRNDEEDKQKFILKLDADLTLIFLRYFFEFILKSLKKYNYAIYELYEDYMIDTAIRIIISKKKDIWNKFYKEEILNLSDQEILAVLGYLFIKGCLSDLHSEEILSYFKKFNFEDIGETFTRFFDKNSEDRDSIYVKPELYSKLGEFGVNLLFYLIKNVKSWEFREDFAYDLESIKEKFPQLVTNVILKYGEYDKMDPELFIYNLIPRLDDKNQSYALSNINFSECLKNLYDIDYVYAFLERLIEDIEKKKIEIEDPLNSKFIESFIHEFIFGEGWESIEDKLYKAFTQLIKEDQIIDVFEKYRIIENLTTNYESKSWGQIRIRWFFIRLFTNLNPQSIIKINAKLPDDIRQGIITELKNEIEEYEFYMENNSFSHTDDKKYTESINELKTVFHIISKNIRELRARLIHNGVWNCKEFEKMEQEFEDNPEKYKFILELLLEDINFYDEYQYNYYFTLDHVVKYTGGKAFLKVLSEQLMPKGWKLEELLGFLEKFFQPYSDGGEPIHVVGHLDNVLREGLKSGDIEYRRLSERFLNYILKLLKFIMRKERLRDPYQDDYVESILGLLVWLYKFYDAKLVDQAVEDLPDKYRKFFYDQKKLLDDFRKEYPGTKF